MKHLAVYAFKSYTSSCISPNDHSPSSAIKYDKRNNWRKEQRRKLKLMSSSRQLYLAAFRVFTWRLRYLYCIALYCYFRHSGEFALPELHLVPGLLAHWSSLLKTLFVKGHPAALGCMLDSFGLTLAGSKHLKGDELRRHAMDRGLCENLLLLLQVKCTSHKASNVFFLF